MTRQPEKKSGFDPEALIYKVFLSFKLLIKPHASWTELEENEPNVLDLGASLVLLVPLAFLARASGRAMAGKEFVWSIVEAFLFYFLLLMITLGAGVLIWILMEKGKQKLSLRPFILMVYASGPLWIFSVFYLIPVLSLHPYIFLFSFGFGGYLLFSGLPVVFQIDPQRTLLVASIAMMIWVLTSTIFCQLFLMVGFS